MANGALLSEHKLNYLSNNEPPTIPVKHPGQLKMVEQRFCFFGQTSVCCCMQVLHCGMVVGVFSLRCLFKA